MFTGAVLCLCARWKVGGGGKPFEEGLVREKKGYLGRLEEISWWEDQKESVSVEAEGNLNRHQGTENVKPPASARNASAVMQHNTDEALPFLKREPTEKVILF